MNTDNYSFHFYIDTLDKHTWSEFIGLFDDATVYQTWSYASVMYGKSNLNHVIIKEKDVVVAIAQVAIRNFPSLYTATANVHWGPLWRRKGQIPEIEHLRQIIRVLRDEYVIKRRLLLRIWPNEIDRPDSAVRDILKSQGFFHNSQYPSYRTLHLCIAADLDELRKNLNQKWRNQLNRAEKDNLDIIEGTSDELYEVFLKLQKEMLSRKNYSPGVSYNDYRLIQNDLPEYIKMKIMICEHEGEPVSAAICSAIGNTGIYLLGATGDKGMKFNSSNLLQWNMIKWLKHHGCKKYDLGGIDPEGNPGVYRFKCGIVGKNGLDVQHVGQFVAHCTFRARLLAFLLVKTISVRKLISVARIKRERAARLILRRLSCQE